MFIFPEIKSINQEVKLEILDQKDISLHLKREDQSHSFYGGNKIRKLKYHVLEALDNNYSSFLTFGGAWSNHIYASAAFFNEIGKPIIGVIRGEEPKRYSDTLLFAKEQGMQLVFVSRSEYRLKSESDFLNIISEKYNNPYIIPEGGSGQNGVKGCTEILTDNDSKFDVITLGVGTGGTLSGINLSLKKHQRSIGFSALKGGGFLNEDVKELMNHFDSWDNLDFLKNQFKIQTDYHFGGFAKTKPELISFMRDFHDKTQIKLDPVYTGKMMYGLIDLIKQDYFKKGTKILAIHTGGIQGVKGWERNNGELLYS